MFRKPVAHIIKPDPRAPSLHPPRQYAIHERMPKDHRRENIATYADSRYRWPDLRFPAFVKRSMQCAIAYESMVATVNSKSNSRGDMCDEGERYKKRLEEGRLVVRPCEEEIRLGFRN